MAKKNNTKAGRVATGIGGLDSLISGGFPERTIALVSGGPGTGKTLFSLQFLMEGARKGEKCCYFSMNEREAELVRACKSVKSLGDVDQYLGKNLVFKVLESESGFRLKELFDILAAYPKVDRLVIDNLNKLLVFSDNLRDFRTQLARIVPQIKEKSNSTILISETEGTEFHTTNGEGFETDSVIHLSYLDLEEKPLRTIEVIKMRYTTFDARVKHSLSLDGKGMSLGKEKVI